MTRKDLAIRVLFPGILLFLLAIPVTLAFRAPYRVLVKDMNGSFFNARSLLVIGDTMFCMRGKAIHATRDAAIENSGEGHAPALLRVHECSLIEIIPETQEPAAAGGIGARYLGLYKVSVVGHQGYLFLAEKDGVLYGSIRFPQWANGVNEPLRNVRFENGAISFTRSVTDPRELRRVGASTYFVQQYAGRYRADGNAISGFYLKDGAKMLWEATRVK